MNNFVQNSAMIPRTVYNKSMLRMLANLQLIWWMMMDKCSRQVLLWICVVPQLMKKKAMSSSLACQGSRSRVTNSEKKKTIQSAYAAQ